MSGPNQPLDASWDAAAALWLQLFGEPPPVRCDLEMLLGVLVASVALPGPYHVLVEPSRSRPVGHPVHTAEIAMPHQNTGSSKATRQNSVTGYTPGNDQARDEHRSAHGEPRSYAASDVKEATLAPPAAGEVADYDGDGEALNMAGGQQGSNHVNRPHKTESQRGQGRKTHEASRQILRGGSAEG